MSAYLLNKIFHTKANIKKKSVYTDCIKTTKHYTISSHTISHPSIPCHTKSYTKTYKLLEKVMITD